MSKFGYAQDIQFSQFYNAQLYQNPGFAGASHLPRVSFHNRLQWPALDAKYMTSMFSFDGYAAKYSSGYGIYVLKDWQGGNKINSTEVAAQYAYELHITSGLTFRPGLQLSYVSRSLNYGLTRPEDYDDRLGYTGGSSLSPGGMKQFVDVSSGGILYSDKAWLGVTVNHMNTPNTSFMGHVSDLPAKFSFTGGYKFIINKDPYRHEESLSDDKSICIIPTAHYKFQGTSDQLDLGLYGKYEYLVLGFWYRGIPIKNYSKELVNNESIILSAGYKVSQFSFTYSYDFTMSRLVRVGTGGSHELNVTYLYKKHKHRKIMKRLPCPNFH